MQLYTVVENNDNATKTVDGIYVEKKNYSNKELVEFIEIAKYYYIHIHTETESTDFNDNYSDSWDNYINCNYLNLVIKDDKLYGFIASGLSTYNGDFVVLTFDKPELKLIDGSVYSSIDKTFKLKKYDLPEEALDLIQNVRITRSYKCFRVIKEEEKFDSEGTDSYFINGFDCVVEDGKVLCIKCCDRTFVLDDFTTYEQNYVVDSVVGVVKYRYYYHIVMNKI